MLYILNPINRKSFSTHQTKWVLKENGKLLAMTSSKTGTQTTETRYQLGKTSSHGHHRFPNVNFVRFIKQIFFI